jgi:hypothetical protein
VPTIQFLRDVYRGAWAYDARRGRWRRPASGPYERAEAWWSVGMLYVEVDGRVSVFAESVVRWAEGRVAS